jgi:hypothetical protein
MKDLLFFAFLNWFKVVVGPFGQSNMHRRLDFCLDQPGKNRMLMCSYELTVLIYYISTLYPSGMIDKMKIFIDLVKTDPSESDEMLLKKVAPSSGNSANQASSANNSNVHDLINSAEMKSEPDEPTGVSEEDLGFLQNMNLTSLVREFEMEAAAASGEGGAQHLGILSLADDVDTENPFSELEDHDHHEQSNGNMTDSLNDIGFE